MSEHTPTPWRLEVSPGFLHYRKILGADEKLVADFDDYDENGGDATSNSEFVLRACNMHDELVEALKNAADALSYCQTALPESAMFLRKVQVTHDAVRAVLSKALAEQPPSRDGVGK